MQDKSKEELKAQRRMYYEAHREEILRKYRMKKQKLTPEDRMEIWNEQLQKRIDEETDETIRYWLQHQLNFNKKMLENGET